MNGSKVNTKLQQALQKGFVPEGVLHLQTQIDARIQTIMATTGAPLNAVMWDNWRHINFHINYFANRFPFCVKSKDRNDWNIIINTAVRYGILYGSSGLYKDYNNEPQIINVSKYDKDKAEIAILPKDYKQIDLKYKSMIKVPRKQVAEYRFETIALPIITMINPLLKFESNITKGYISSTIVNAPRVGLKHTNASNSAENIRNFAELNNFAMVIPEGGTDQILSYNLSTDIKGFNELAQQGLKWYYDMIGRRTNTSFKKEHIGEYEEMNSSANVAAVEFERYLYIKKFLMEVSDLFGIEIYLENLNGVMENCKNDIVTEVQQPHTEEAKNVPNKN